MVVKKSQVKIKSYNVESKSGGVNNSVKISSDLFIFPARFSLAFVKYFERHKQKKTTPAYDTEATHS